MGLVNSKEMICPVEMQCTEWARKHMGYCLCSTNDWLSLILGLLSVMTWSVAEIPQIITNYRQKSAEGLSISFLMTWLVGDFFNLVGCMLEAATLPTQYYTAVLYTVTSVLLFGQAVFYRFILKFSKRRQQEAVQAGALDRRRENNYGDDTENVNEVERWEDAPSSPVHLAPSSPSGSEELYFMSARSLSLSRTPPALSYLSSRLSTSDVERRWIKEPLLGEVRPTQSTPAQSIKSTLCVVSLMMFFLGSRNHQLAGRPNIRSPAAGAMVFRVGRRLSASAPETSAAGVSGIGAILGWGMAAIYMGGRLPQIWLNIRRGNAEGLNPLMFVFAIFGNTTYVASILFNSLEWSKIQPNLPWLVDAAGCVLLDTFILSQFIYFRYRSRTRVEKYVA